MGGGVLALLIQGEPPGVGLRLEGGCRSPVDRPGASPGFVESGVCSFDRGLTRPTEPRARVPQARTKQPLLRIPAEGAGKRRVTLA